MKLRIERDTLADAVAWAARTLPAKPPNPVLSGVLLTAGEEQVSLSSSDQAVSSQVSLEADVDEPGQAVVSGRLLADIAKSLPAQPVVVHLEGTRLVVRCGRASFILPTLPVEEYPALPALPPILGSCSGPDLAGAVASVGVAALRDDTLPMLTGIRMEFAADAITLAATDRFRLAMRELPWQPTGSDPDASVLVRAKTLTDISRPLAAAEEVEIALDGSQSLIGFTGAMRRSTTPVLDADYPDVRKLLPTESSTLAEVAAADLIESVKRVKLVADRPSVPIQLDFSDSELLLRAGAGDEAHATETLECSLEGDPIKIAFNPDYLLDGLGAIPGERVRIAMKEPKRPAVFTAAEHDVDYRYLLMPVRLTS